MCDFASMINIDGNHESSRRIAFFFFNDTATTEIYTLSLHDALPILLAQRLELALQLGGSFIRDGRDAQHGGVGGPRREGGQGGGGQHAGSRPAPRRAGRREVGPGWGPFKQPPPPRDTAGLRGPRGSRRPK